MDKNVLTFFKFTMGQSDFYYGAFHRDLGTSTIKVKKRKMTMANSRTVVGFIISLIVNFHFEEI